MSRSFFHTGPPLANIENQGSLLEEIRNPGQTGNMKGPSTHRQTGKSLMTPSWHLLTLCDLEKKFHPLTSKTDGKTIFQVPWLVSNIFSTVFKKEGAWCIWNSHSKELPRGVAGVSFLEHQAGLAELLSGGKAGGKNSECPLSFACWVPDHLLTLK